MSRTCSVRTCRALSAQTILNGEPQPRTYRFPRDNEVRAKWDLFVNQANHTDHFRGNAQVVCARHFDSSCFSETGSLLPKSVPTIADRFSLEVAVKFGVTKKLKTMDMNVINNFTNTVVQIRDNEVQSTDTNLEQVIVPSTSQSISTMKTDEAAYQRNPLTQLFGLPPPVMDEFIFPEVIVKEENLEDDGVVSTDILSQLEINKSTMWDNSSNEEVIVPDLITTLPEVTVKEESIDPEERILDAATGKLVLPNDENHLVKQVKIEILDPDDKEEQLSSGQESEPDYTETSSKRKQSDDASSTPESHLTKRSRLKCDDESVPGPSTKSAVVKKTHSRRARAKWTSIIDGDQDSDDPTDPDYTALSEDDSEKSESDPVKSTKGSGSAGLVSGSAGLVSGSAGEGSARIFAKSDYPNYDDLLYCVDCKCAWEGDCPDHGPLIVVNDIAVPMNVSGEISSERSAPLLVKIDKTKGAIAALPILNRTRFGPFEGKIGPPGLVNQYTRPVFINGKLDHCIDASDPALSNWMRFVRSTENDNEKNLDAYQYKGQIYFRSIRQISRGEELVVSREMSKEVTFTEDTIDPDPEERILDAATGELVLPSDENYQEEQVKIEILDPGYKEEQVFSGQESEPDHTETSSKRKQSDDASSTPESHLTKRSRLKCDDESVPGPSAKSAAVKKTHSRRARAKLTSVIDGDQDSDDPTDPDYTALSEDDSEESESEPAKSTKGSGSAGLVSGSAGLFSGSAGLRSGPAGFRSGPAGFRSGPAGFRFGPAGFRFGLAGEGSACIFAKSDYPNCDDLLYCVDCKCAWEGDCPEHGPLIVVDDMTVPMNVSAEIRSERSAPLLVKIDKTKGVIAALSILNRTRFGPFEGKIGPPGLVNQYTRPVFKNGKLDHCIDASDPALSNWMRFVRSTENDNERNLDAYQYKGQIYFRSIRRISRGEELVVSRETSKGVFREYLRSESYIKEEPSQEDMDDDLEERVGISAHSKVMRCYDEVCGQGPETCSVKVMLQEGQTGSIVLPSDPEKCTNNVKIKQEFVSPESERTLSAKESKIAYPCAECPEKFSSQGLLDLHVFFHAKEKPFKCNECNHRFTSEGSLEAHAQTHSGLVTVVECTVCNERFPDEIFLNFHTRSHSGAKRFVCTVCDQRFARKYTLNMHIRTHTNERPFECPVCKLQFAVKVNLQSHQRIHTGIKPFVCSECNRSFGRKSHLRGHMRIHSGEKPFECSMCDQRFLHKHNQIKHERTHTKARPFVCPECPQRFCYKSHLKEHLRIHTGGAAWTGPILKDGSGSQD